MPSFNNLKDLIKYAEAKANSVLKNEVAEAVVETMRDKIEETVYAKYSPKMYERTGDLLRDIDVEVVNDNTISVENVRYEDGRNIAAIIESGDGYSFTPPEYNPYDELGRTYLTPRPFTEETRSELQRTDKLHQTMKKGLKARGINAI